VRPGSGVNNVIVGLAQALSRDFQPEIIVTGWHEAPEEGVWLKLPAFELAPRKLFGFLVRLLPNAIRLIRLSRGAVALNAHFFGSEMLPVILLRKLGLLPKIVLSVHGADVTDAAEGPGWQRAVYAFICRHADAVIACSQALGGEVRALSPHAPTFSVWNGVSPAPAAFGPRPIPERYLVSVAAFVKKKGHDVLLDAFERLSADFPNLKLVLIGGDGPERQSIEQHIRTAGLENRVELIVNLDHDRIWDWMHHAECFVHAAREEPFGIAVLEAALAQTPVVATAVGGIREYLTDGVEGLTCPPDQPEQFAARIRESLLDPARARARALAFRNKASRFTWDAAWDRYRAVSGI
jgi:glycosyltransferase involved in cell wall biosynthesis